MFGYEDETPYRNYTSKQTFKKHVQLLLLSNYKDSHYALIKDLNRFMFLFKKNIMVKNIFVNIAYNVSVA